MKRRGLPPNIYMLLEVGFGICLSSCIVGFSTSRYMHIIARHKTFRSQWLTSTLASWSPRRLSAPDAS